MIEVFSIVTNNTFMLLIPHKYKMVVGTGENVFSVCEVQLTQNNQSVLDKYSDITSLIQTEQGYDDRISNKQDPTKGDIENNLTEKYNIPVNIKTKDKKYTPVLRQISRLSKTITGTKYKICMVFAGTVMVSDSTSNIKSYAFKEENKITDEYIRLYASLYISDIITNIEHISSDVEQIHSTINKTLAVNIKENLNILKKTIKDETLLESNLKKVYSKISEYRKRSARLVEILQGISSDENKLIKTRNDTLSKIKNKTTRHVSGDIEYQKYKHDYDVKLEKIYNEKREVIRNIISLNVKCNSLLFNTDITVFDNTVMSETIRKSIEGMV